MNKKKIDEVPEFRVMVDRLCALQKEMGDNNRRKDELHVELSSLLTNNRQEDAWNIYLDSTSHRAQAKRDELREELGRLESRQEFLRHAREKGQEAVEILRARLSRNPCEDGRKQSLAHIRRIFRALDEIAAANHELREIRSTIEDAGYRSGALPIAEFNLADEGWRKYVKDQFPEV